MGELRESKKRETRQRISDVATKLFLTRGFDAVTFDDIAARAKVSRMTVFNYFPRKEDLMLDRTDDLKLVFFRDVVRATPAGRSPIAALRAFLVELRKRPHPFARFDDFTATWWRFVSASPSLEARLRELNDEAADGLAIELDGPNPSGLARLAAGMTVLAVRTSRAEAMRVLERGGSSKQAHAVFFELLDQGLAAVQAMLSKRSDITRRGV